MKRVEELLQLIRPGDRLVKYFIRPSGLTLDQVAKETEMSVEDINEIVQSKRKITPEIAERFDRCFGWPAQTLLDWQLLYDIEVHMLGQESFLADLAMHVLGQESFLAEVKARLKMLKKDRAFVKRRLRGRL